MPTVLRRGPYRFFFVALDQAEPPHIHVQREKMVAKFWLDPVVLQNIGGFGRNELNAIAKLVNEINNFSWRNGMSSLAVEKQGARAQNIFVSDDSLQIDLTDGRTTIVPLMWYPRLWYGTPEERNNYQIIGDGEYIHWPELDEDLTVSGIIAGHRSAESPSSLKRWLNERMKK